MSRRPSPSCALPARPCQCALVPQATPRETRSKRRSQAHAAAEGRTRRWLPSLTSSLLLLLLASTLFGAASLLALQHAPQLKQAASSSWWVPATAGSCRLAMWCLSCEGTWPGALAGRNCSCGG